MCHMCHTTGKKRSFHPCTPWEVIVYIWKRINPIPDITLGVIRFLKYPIASHVVERHVLFHRNGFSHRRGFSSVAKLRTRNNMI